MITETQMPEYFRDIIEDQVKIHEEGRSIQVVNNIPDTTSIPIGDQHHWLRIPDVVDASYIFKAYVSCDQSREALISAIGKQKVDLEIVINGYLFFH